MAGAGGSIAATKIATSPPDGYALYVGTYNLILNQIFGKFSQDVRETLAPIANITAQGTMLFVSTTVPVNDLKQLIDHAKRNPGKLNYYSSGVGSSFHLGMIAFEAHTGTKMTHITYKGAAQAAHDLASGAIHLMFGSFSGLSVVRTGKARILAVAGRQRLSEFPEIPTMIEMGIPNFDLTQLVTLYAPAGTPLGILEAVNREFAKAASAPDVLSKFTSSGAFAPPNPTPMELRKALTFEYDRWNEVVKKANIKLEH